MIKKNINNKVLFKICFKMSNLISIFICVIFIICQYNANAYISDKRLCVDENCSVPISRGMTKKKYTSPTGGLRLSFDLNENVIVYSYGAGSMPNLHGVEINGKRGYVDKIFIKELERLKEPKLVVDTENKEPKKNINVDRTKLAYEIVDGTKLPLELEQTTTSTINSNVHEEIDVESANATEKLPPADDLGKINFESEHKHIKPDEKEEIDIETEDVTDELSVTESIKSQESTLKNELISTTNSRELLQHNEEKKVDVELIEAVEQKKVEIKDVVEEINKVTEENKTTEIVSVAEEFNTVLSAANKSENVFKNPFTVDIIPTYSAIDNASTDPIQEIEVTKKVQENVEEEEVINLEAPPLVIETSTAVVPSLNDDENIQEVKDNIKTEEPTNSNSIFANILPIIQTTTEITPEQDKPYPVTNEPENKVPNLSHEITVENLIENTTNLIKEHTDDTIEKENTIEENVSVEEQTKNSEEENTAVKEQEEDKYVEKEEVETNVILDELELTDSVTEQSVSSELEAESNGFLSTILSYFPFWNDAEKEEDPYDSFDIKEIDFKSLIASKDFPVIDEQKDPLPAATAAPTTTTLFSSYFEMRHSNMAIYLITTALSILLLLIIWFIMDKCRREVPLLRQINKLEKQLMTTCKEKQMLEEKIREFDERMETIQGEAVTIKNLDELKQQLLESENEKLALEGQIQMLEKELDNSTEVGIELNKIIAEMLSSSSDNSAILKTNVEQMQKKLLEQQGTINATNELVKVKEIENEEMKLQLTSSNIKLRELQTEIDKMVEKILQSELDQNDQREKWENKIQQLEMKIKEHELNQQTLKTQIQMLHQQNLDLKTMSEIKIKEYNLLKENLNRIESLKNNKDTVQSILEVGEIKAQLEHYVDENHKYSQQLKTETEKNSIYTKTIEKLNESIKEINEKYEKNDKEKVEIKTKLEVLNNYFKEKEEQMQKQISKYESMWMAKEGEASTTSERFRYLQDELQQCKKQNDDLKQEIINQEVELKSQISMLENKASENWLVNRQIERKLEEAKQEAAQLRNILTLRERAVEGNNNNNNGQIRIQSPPYQNGELFNPISPQPPQYSSTQSPPPPALFYPSSSQAAEIRTKSPSNIHVPPLPPFLPPPPSSVGGALPPPPPPYIPFPPLDGMLPLPLPSSNTAIGARDMPTLPSPFMPPPPPSSGMYPDHRLPPLGRLSSPPPRGNNARYSPESTIYSEYEPYDRRSRSSEDDDDDDDDDESGEWKEWVNDEWEKGSRKRSNHNYKRTMSTSSRSNGKTGKAGVHSSGSENGNIEQSRKKLSHLRKV